MSARTHGFVWPILAVLASPAVAGDCTFEKIFAPDGEMNDSFGTAVDLDGTTAVVGARDAGDDTAGAAYLYELEDGQWAYRQTLVSPDPNVQQRFGASAALEGDIVVMGAPFDDELGGQAGAVYVFVRDGNTWSLQQKLLGSDTDASDYFGWSVDLSGDTIVVGAQRANFQERGAAYVFVRAGGVWTEQADFDGTEGRFGEAVTIDGDTMAVGAPGENVDAGRSGAAHVFTRSGNAWSLQQTVSIAQSFGFFGHALALDGDRLLVGSYWTSGGQDASGRAHPWRRTNGVWSLEQELLPSPAGGDATPDGFGTTVALEGDLAVVGATHPDSGGAERVYFFGRDPNSGTWSEATVLEPLVQSDDRYDAFGMAVALSAGRAMIGAQGDDDLTSNAGAAYVIDDPLACLPCPSDVDGDGVTDFTDVLLVLGAWGTSDPNADVNDDGIVDFLDLLDVLAGWGGCP